MLKRLGKRAGIANLRTHQFRHSYTVNALRAGMPEQVLKIIGGWKKYRRPISGRWGRRTPGSSIGK